jgi:signal transduction histidine kinase
LSRLVDWIDRHALSASLRSGDGDTLRRARLLVVVTLLLLAPNLLFDTLFLLTGEWLQMLSSVALGSCYLSGLTIVRRRGDLALATHLICGPLILLVLGHCYQHGGVLEPSGWSWVVLGVLMAFLLGGARVGKVWAAVHFAAVFVSIGAIVLGTSTTPDAAGIAPIASFSVIGLSVMFIGVALAYERMKDRMVTSLREASQRARLVLDNIGDGYLLVHADGRLTNERSAASEHWFGPTVPDVLVWDYLMESDDDRLRMSLGWEEIIADILPRELLVDQMPKRITRGSRTWSLQYCVVGEAEVRAIVVVVREITVALAALRAEEERAEQMQLFDLITRDAEGFRLFLKDARQAIAGLDTAHPVIQQRMLHTLKGNAGQVGARTVASMCHQIEERIACGDAVRDSDADELSRRLETIARRFVVLLADPKDALHLDGADVGSLRAAIRRGGTASELEALIDGWSGESMHQRLTRITDQARSLASRLGRSNVDAVVEGEALRYPRGRLDELFASFSHLIRNAVDHGIEPQEERLRAAKPARGTLELRSERTDDALVFTIGDDGRGVEWSRVRERALARGMPAETQADLAAALFEDGFTTKDHVDEISGRGIGMAAVAHAAHKLGGTVRLDSTWGVGTVVTVVVPAAAVFGTPRERQAAVA